MKDPKKKKKGLSDAELIAKYGDLKTPLEKAVKKMLNTQLPTSFPKIAH